MPSISLPEVFDRTTVRPVQDAILAGRNDDMVIDAGAVRRISALGLEMLLATALQWQHDDKRLSVVNMSDAFLDSLTHLGATPDDLQVEAGQ